MLIFDLYKSTEHVSRITENILQENTYRNFDIISKLSIVTLSSFKHCRSILCNTTLLETLDGCAPRCSSGANAGGSAFCHELDIGWVHIVQWIFSILAISDWLF